MRLTRIGVLLLLWAVVACPSILVEPGWDSALAQRSGGGVGGRGVFHTTPQSLHSPGQPLTIPIAAPTHPRSYPSYPTYPRDYYPPYPSARPPIYVAPGAGYGTDLIALLFIGGIVLVSISMMRGLQQAGRDKEGEVESSVARLRLAVLYTPELQASLRHTAQTAETESPRGLADLIDNTAVLLLRAQDGWRFGMYEVWTGSLEKAEGQFDAWMTETRSEFIETYRHFEGKEEVQPGYQSKVEPDGRYILVTLLLAVSGSLPPYQALCAAREPDRP